ncbi:potassium/sodium hyperpolarization-activated cyclic nucleotide-gated channel 1 [Cephus cinctus]|uniref:Potassium/sodium hyperpolarization-activated cyclic nucleotide-gated channel 1 n=1 Tax=Cephus cinctus TaxID=211228 RepID=A0AAJ7FM66_CEPCN|nr:potassium/sodium hyperpolarization-activated cyclic nucleotide-gated channel 1 [Cephus cinctus]XP_024942462.1 potassium/sodium hyperpolarization-activated cyclic nucleotide-gated channel 1 [Cephus cinctus]
MLHSDHECEINMTQNEILFLPGKGPFRKLRMALRRSIMASEKNPSAYIYLRSRSSILMEKRRHLRNHKHVIHPFSLFRQWWDFIMIFAITGGLLAIPYKAAFVMIDRTLTWTCVKNCVLLMCWADIIVNLMTGFYDKTDRIVHLREKEIILRYLIRGTFFPDLLGSIPTDLIFIGMWNDWIVARECSSLVYIFRIFSMYSYISKLSRTYEIPRVFYKLSSMIFCVMMGFHWQACIYWIIPVMVTSMKLPTQPSAESWITSSKLWDSDSQSQYISSLLRSVAVFTCSGDVEMAPQTVEDQWLVIVLQVLGSLTFCLVIAYGMQLFKGNNSSKLKYQATMAQLRQYMRHKQLSAQTQKRFVTYYEFRFYHQFFRENEILNSLSAQMRQEIGMHSCRKLVENVTFFNNLPMSVLVRIVALLRSEVFLANDVIVRSNQPGDCMYFIATGTVAIYTNSGKEVCHLEDGAHFGEIALVMPDERRVASVVAVEVCELYRLERADFARTIHPYPMLWERIKKIAVERHEKTTILNAQ